MEQKQLNVNALNNDGFSVLDLAVLINNRPITKLLLQHGAQTGNFPVESLETHLNTLLANSEKKLAQFVSNTGSSSQGCIGLETERQKLMIEKRIKLIRKMINGWQRLKVPDPPFSFTIGKIIIITKRVVFVIAMCCICYLLLLCFHRCYWDEFSTDKNIGAYRRYYLYNI